LSVHFALRNVQGKARRRSPVPPDRPPLLSPSGLGIGRCRLTGPHSYHPHLQWPPARTPPLSLPLPLQVCLSLVGTWHAAHESEKWDPTRTTVFQVLMSIQARRQHNRPAHPQRAGWLGWDVCARPSSGLLTHSGCLCMRLCATDCWSGTAAWQTICLSF
jgi:hypothetical protein